MEKAPQAQTSIQEGT